MNSYDAFELPDVETVTFEAVRGTDGLLGIQILSHPPDVHNVIVVVEADSRAARDGLFRLGDVIIQVDDLAVEGIDMIGAGAFAVARQTHTFTVRRFKSEQARRASLEATKPLDPSEVPTIRPSGPTSAPIEAVGRLNLSASTMRGDGAADPFVLTASTPRDVVFAQAAALQRKYSAQAAAQATLVTPRTKGNQSGALSRAKTAKARRASVAGATHAVVAVLAH